MIKPKATTVDVTMYHILTHVPPIIFIICLYGTPIGITLSSRPSSPQRNPDGTTTVNESDHVAWGRQANQACVVYKRPEGQRNNSSTNARMTKILQGRTLRLQIGRVLTNDVNILWTEFNEVRST